jgi:hypothetical protein
MSVKEYRPVGSEECTAIILAHLQRASYTSLDLGLKDPGYGLSGRPPDLTPLIFSEIMNWSSIDKPDPTDSPLTEMTDLTDSFHANHSKNQ